MRSLGSFESDSFTCLLELQGLEGLFGHGVRDTLGYGTVVRSWLTTSDNQNCVPLPRVYILGTRFILLVQRSGT